MNSCPVSAPRTGLIVVTGAGGFVGGEIAAQLAARGHRVLATDIAFGPRERTTLAACDLHCGPPEAAIAACTEAPLAVIHAAALTANPEEAGLSAAAHLCLNTDLLLRSLAAARTAGTGRFLFLSSSGIFAPGDGAGRLLETTPATGSSPYAAAKRAGEILVAGAAEPGFETLSLRLGHLFGPHECVRPSRPGLSLVQRLLDAAEAGEPLVLTSPEARRDWTWLPDVARAVERLIEARWSLPLWHCTSGRVCTDAELARAIARLTGTKAATARSNVPTPALKLPMASLHSEILPDFAWTDPVTALSLLVRERGCP